MLSIIIPAYNEEKRIGATLEAYGGFFIDKFFKETLHCEILVIINNSTDKTLEIVKEYMKKYKNIGYLNLKPGGKGFALIEGFKIARGDYIGFVDADMSTYPEHFYDLYKNIGSYDGIIASRWLENSITKRTFGKYIRSKGFNYLVRTLFLFPYKDTQCGAKIFKKENLMKIIPEMMSMKWAFDVNLLYLMKKNEYLVKEHPTLWVDKAGSKLSPKVPIQMAAGVIRLRLVYSPFNFLVRFYDLIPGKVKLHH